MMIRTLILALSLNIAATPAMATESENKAAAIRTDDLNLTRAADRARLDVRVKSAARSICRLGTRGLAEMTRQSECVAEAIARAEPQAKRAIARAQNGTQLALLMVDAAR
ncbi:MAG: UrcA family protein [Sphingopyxis sp.]|nr:UrcA family protein [Sphingopyxis sp.]